VTRPKRVAEARITLGVVAARQGYLDEGVRQGEHALHSPWKSLPTLLMVSRDLTTVLNDLYRAAPNTREYTDQLRVLGSSGSQSSG
jgi:hypothetical protein